MFHPNTTLLYTAIASAVLSAGCTVNTCEEGAICLDEHQRGASYQCAVLCRHLADCDRIDRDQRGACLDACEEAFAHDEETLEDYCECSAESTCRELSRECGRQPFSLSPPEDDEEPNEQGEDSGAPPGPGPSPDGGGAGSMDNMDAGAPGQPEDAGTDSGAPQLDASPPHDSPDAGRGPDAVAGACSRDEDCAASEGCLEGGCHARCEASCQCRLGDVCESGLCVTPPPATMSCQTDCDCPAGTRCVESVCAADGAAPQ